MMRGRKVRAGKKKAGLKRLRPGEVRLSSAGEAVLTYKEAPAKPPEDKRIHPRRPLPLVPEAPAEDTGEDQRKDQSDSSRRDSKE